MKESMLLLSRTIYDARAVIWQEFEGGKIDATRAHQALLDLDPHDHIALLGLGRLGKSAGAMAEAREYFWRAVQAHPTVITPYLELAQLYFGDPESDALAEGLSELGLRRHSKHLPEPDYAKAGLEGTALDALLSLPVETRRMVLTEAIRQRRTSEPQETTARLRGLRLLQELLENDPVEPILVDKILHEGESMVPLLIGVLRDWAQDFMDEEGDAAMENAMALLGETAPAAEIPHLLEFVDLDHETAAGVARWAISRVLERHPDEAVRLLTAIAPRLGPAERLEIGRQILERPTLDPAGDLHYRLGENLEHMSADSRNVFFPSWLGSLALTRGPLGIKLGLKALEQQRGRISKTVWRECGEMLAIAQEIGRPPLQLEPSPYTVYDICAGNAIWDEADDDEEESLPVPEPIAHRREVPGRNDPCWCGSGKKYKKCHLDADEAAQRKPPPRVAEVPGMNEFAPLRQRIGAFPSEVLSGGEIKRAARDFFGEEPGDEMMLLDWIIHDFVAPSLGRTLMEEFLIRNSSRLTARERQMVEAWAESHVGLYETQHLTPGMGAELRDLHSGETMFVHDVNLSNRMARWEVFFARLVPGERGTEITGAALTVPRTSIGPLREWMDESRRQAGLAWPEFSKRNWPRIRRQSFETSTKWAESLRLKNTAGDDLLFSKATYRITDEISVLKALQKSREFEAELDEATGRETFIWLDKSKTILGHIRTDGYQLVLECNSRERLERGSRLLSRLAGEGLEHVRDEFTSQAEIRRQAREAPATKPVENPIPKEERERVIHQLLEKHYQEWPDMKLPALNGKTPRAAVRTVLGRLQVREILKTMENGEDRKRLAGEPFFDINRLRVTLKLD
jgi:hypothetical protein